jgi:tRNA pseudouridine55 synthase
MSAGRPEKRDVHGWIALDKAAGKTSTESVAAMRRLFHAKKAGHAGTLDPLATGVLPIALGEATKTVPFVMDGRKTYRFTVRWGVETDTDDAEGRVLSTSDVRPGPEAIRAALPRFVGEIAQVPPRYSALKIEGERAYDLARQGEAVTLAARPVEVHRLELVDTPDADHTTFEAECGKGTYVRALARDLGRSLGSLGHVESLRRTRVGPFAERDAVTLAELAKLLETGGEAALTSALKPVETGVQALPAVNVSRGDAQRLVLGQSVLLRGRDAPLVAGLVSVSTGGALVALAEMEQGALKPKRIFNLPR